MDHSTQTPRLHLQLGNQDQTLNQAPTPDKTSKQTRKKRRRRAKLLILQTIGQRYH